MGKGKSLRIREECPECGEQLYSWPTMKYKSCTNCEYEEKNYKKGDE